MSTATASPKYDIVMVDTINQLQNDLYVKLLKDKGKATFDDWKDYGTEILFLFKTIRELPNTEIILILGYEGTGKTVGGRNLDPSTTLWLNCDKKQLSFSGGNKKYNSTTGNYRETSTYEEAKNAIIYAANNRANPKFPLLVFILGHIEDYKVANEGTRQRLKVIGKMATKLNIEGAVVHTYYTQVEVEGDKVFYKLMTSTNGFNTARSPMDMFPEKIIDNDFTIIRDRIYEEFK